MNNVDIVAEINEEIIDILEKSGFDLPDHYFFPLDYVTDGYYELIRFIHIDIWSSENDERDWSEDCDDFEPLKPFLWKQINKCLNYCEIIKDAIK